MLARSERKEEAGFSPFSLLGELLSVPGNFIGGLIVGLVTPIAALAGIVGGVYLFTKKVPFFVQTATEEEPGERSLRLKLMPPDQAREAFQDQMTELKEAWARVQKDLAEVVRQSEEYPLSEETAAEP